MSDYWTENGIEKPQSIIVCAACKFGKVIIAGARHFDSVMQTQIACMGGVKNMRQIHGFEEQGFIDQFGNFYDRIEAMDIVKKNGQKFNAERNSHDTELFSEGLY